MKSDKDDFLDKYNRDRELDVALDRGITASVQHNSLYRVGLPPKDRKTVRCEWKTYLCELKERYKSAQSVKSYEDNIEELKKKMNENTKLEGMFRKEKYNRNEPGFRISHAQKSISVFLKHLWCMDEVACPPQCPVDSIILKAAGKRYPDTNWGYVNSIEEHRKKINFLLEAKTDSSESLAEWELKEFRA
jgi:hypothetical protein